MTKIIFLNGPPRCGKDTAADAIINYFPDITRKERLSTPLKEIASQWMGNPESKLEKTKDVILQQHMQTYRSYQISVFKALCTVFGDEWLGRILYNKIKNSDEEYFVIIDAGRTTDIQPFIRNMDSNDLMILQIMRRDCNFENDIRSYIAAPSVKTVPIINDDINKFKEQVVSIASDFFAGGV